MKVRQLVSPMFLFCLIAAAYLPACEEKQEAEPEAAGETGGAATTGAEVVKKEEPPPPPVPKPEEVCASLITAVKAKDAAQVKSLSTAGTEAALETEPVKEHVMTQLAAATCGSARMEGDVAMVSLTAGEVAQDAPFVKEGGKDWKFDGAAYLQKYPVPDKHAKAKSKTKDAKGKKAKIKQKHKK